MSVCSHLCEYVCVCINMYVCTWGVYVCVCVGVNMCARVYVHVYMVHIHVCIYSCVHICVCVWCVYVCMCMCVLSLCLYDGCVFVCVCVYRRIYVCMCVHICTHIRVHICVYMCVHACVCACMCVHVCVCTEQLTAETPFSFLPLRGKINGTIMSLQGLGSYHHPTRCGGLLFYSLFFSERLCQWNKKQIHGACAQLKKQNKGMLQ